MTGQQVDHNMETTCMGAAAGDSSSDFECSGRASAHQHADLLNKVPAIMYRYKVNHDTGQSSFPYVSNYCEDLLGVSPASVVEDASALVNLLHPDDIQPFTDAVVASMTDLSLFDHVMRVKNARTNQFMKLYDQSLPVRSQEPNEQTGVLETVTIWEGFMFCMQETHQEKKESQLSKEMEKLMESNLLHFFSLDLDGNVQHWNSAMIETTGYSTDDVESNPFLSLVVDQDKMDVSNFLASIIEQEKNKNSDKSSGGQPTKNVSKLDCAITAKKNRSKHEEQEPLPSDEQQLLHFSLSAKARKDSANKVIGLKSLTEWLSHEIRNPLSVAMEAAQALEDYTKRQQQQQSSSDAVSPLSSQMECVGASYVHLIRRSINYVVDVLTNMLDLNKFAEGKVMMRPQMCSIHNDILVPTREMMCLSSLGKVPVTVVGTDVQLYVDKLRLKQIVTNLVSNAVKYTTQGYITLRVSEDAERDHVVIAVSDSGTGVEPSEYHNLFSRWEQLGSSINGAGIGLCLCKSLAVAMGGDMSLNKSYNSGQPGYPGAQFLVRLPKHSHVKEKSSAFHCLTDALTTTAFQQQDLDQRDIQLPRDACIRGKFRILVVDDELVGQKLLVRRFSRIFPQAKVDCAISGERALEMARETRYDIITMDHFMKVGEMTGEETIRALREQQNVDALIVGISGNAKRAEHLAAGADDFFQKPLPSSEVVVKRFVVKLAPPSGWKVLLVDDAASNLHFLRRKLQHVSAAHFRTIEEAQKRWNITTCTNSDEAKNLLDEQSFDLVILDQTLGGKVTGSDIAEYARSQTNCMEDSVFVLNSGSRSFIQHELPPCFGVGWSKPLPAVKDMRFDLSLQLIHSKFKVAAVTQSQ